MLCGAGLRRARGAAHDLGPSHERARWLSLNPSCVPLARARAAQFNIANPTAGTMHCIDIDDEKKLAAFYDKRMGQEVQGDVLGPEFAGYVFRISGGNDKQGFPMVQGVLTQTRVRLLLSKGAAYYRPRRKGERKRKSVRGCIVGSDIAVLNLVVAEKGAADIPGLTDKASERPRRLGPKRANNIRKLFDLTKEADVRKSVLSRTVEKKGKKTIKRTKIQRLVTPLTLHRKKRLLTAKLAARDKARKDAAEYKKLLEQRAAERRESIAKRRSSRKSSKKEA